MTDSTYYGIEIIVGIIVIPWTVWVSASIFNLRQSHAVMKMEMGLLYEIKEWLLKQKGER